MIPNVNVPVFFASRPRFCIGIWRLWNLKDQKLINKYFLKLGEIGRKFTYFKIFRNEGFYYDSCQFSNLELPLLRLGTHLYMLSAGLPRLYKNFIHFFEFDICHYFTGMKWTLWEFWVDGKPCIDASCEQRDWEHSVKDCVFVRQYDAPDSVKLSLRSQGCWMPN